MKVRELGGFIRDQRNTARLSLRKLSSLTGISNPYLSQIERGLRRPSADILQAIARALRISAETLYVKAGILDERVDGSDPIFEIRRDNTLEDHQKQILIELYESFRTSSHAANGHKPKARKTVAKSATSAKGKKKAASGKKSAAKKPAARKKAPATRKTVARKRVAAATKAKSAKKSTKRKAR